MTVGSVAALGSVVGIISYGAVAVLTATETAAIAIAEVDAAKVALMVAVKTALCQTVFCKELVGQAIGTVAGRMFFFS